MDDITGARTAVAHFEDQDDEPSYYGSGHDLRRILAYVATSRSIALPDEMIKKAATAVVATQEARDRGDRTLSVDAVVQLASCINDLAPRIYPVTLASLEIAELMEVGAIARTRRGRLIQTRVNAVIARWRMFTVVALILCILSFAVAHAGPAAVISLKAVNSQTWLSALPDKLDVRSLAVVLRPSGAGALGACAFILRSILNGISARTFILRDRTVYGLRCVLGIVLGYIAPRLINPTEVPELSLFIVAFLAGYAVEPTFSALDNLVQTLSEFVSRTPTAGASAASK